MRFKEKLNQSFTLNNSQSSQTDPQKQNDTVEANSCFGVATVDVIPSVDNNNVNVSRNNTTTPQYYKDDITLVAMPQCVEETSTMSSYLSNNGEANDSQKLFSCDQECFIQQ